MSHNKSSTRNKWAAVAEDLRDRIISGEFPEGSLLPTGVDLMQEYEISDSTVNRVRAFLHKEGLIYTTSSPVHLAGNRCTVIYNKERDMGKQIQVITGDAMTREDSNEFVWAGYLIDGELRWVQNWDCLSEEIHFPGHTPLIVCTAAEFDHGTLPAPEIVVPVRPA
ncbi:winged helix-turn-helix domain-containing protein [Streptomyces griseoincarnatus]